MKSRKYNKRISIYETVSSPDGFGGETFTDQLLTKSWCQIKTISNNSSYAERLVNLGITQDKTALIINLRKRNDIEYSSIDHFIKYKNEKYIIQLITELNLEDVELEIVAIKEKQI